MLFAYVFAFVCWIRIWLCSQDWPGTHYVAKTGLKLMAIPLPQSPQIWIKGMYYYTQLRNAFEIMGCAEPSPTWYMTGKPHPLHLKNMAAYTRQTLNNDNINRRPKAREEMFQGLTLNQELQTIIVAEKVRMSFSYGWAPSVLSITKWSSLKLCIHKPHQMDTAGCVFIYGCI